MNFVKEYVFYNPNIIDIDEIIDKSCSDCSNKGIYSYKPLDLKYSMKILDKKKK